MFVGVPGSGKTTFAKELAVQLGAVTFNSDAIRLSMWGSRDEIWKTHTDSKKRDYGNRLTFGAMTMQRHKCFRLATVWCTIATQTVEPSGTK